MFARLKGGVAIIALASLAACSTAGGFYKKGDPVHGEFSTWRTVALPFAVAGVIAGAAVVGAAAAQPTPSVQCTYRRVGNTVYQNCW